MERMSSLSINKSITSVPASIRLPSEILDQIFDLVVGSNVDLVKFNVSNQPIVTKLSSEILPLTLVCRNWWLSANRRLYHTITVHRPTQIPSLVSNSSHCLEFIKHLRVIWNIQPYQYHPDLLLLPHLINLSPELSHITLGGEQFDLSSQELLDSFLTRSKSSSELTPITGLSISSIQTRYYGEQRFGPQGRRTSKVLDTLIASCPDLIEGRFDEFRSSYNSMPSQIQNFDIVFPAIRKIVLEKVVVEAGYLNGLLSRLARSGMRELSLKRTSLGSVDSFRDIIVEIGKNLEVLELEECEFFAVWNENEADEPPAVIDFILDSCLSLHTFSLIGTLDSRQPVLETLLPTLKVLTLGARNVRHDTVASALSVGYWPVLEKLAILHGSEWGLQQRRLVWDVIESLNVQASSKCTMEGLWE